MARGREAGVYEGEATLGALEGVLRAHRDIPGRKAVVLFTTPAFTGRRDDLMDRYMEPLRQLAQQGFAVWTVDTGGVAARGGEAKTYFGMLAKETGGATVRGAVDLTSAFREAADQLSCYYLISLPVPQGREAGTTTHALTVALDTKRRPELWKHELRAPTRVTLLDPRTRIQRERVAALLSPDDFDKPPVSAALGFPVRSASGDVLPARFRVPLAELTWLPEAAGGYTAKVLFDGAVQRDDGSRLSAVCELGAEKGGQLALRLPRPPAPTSRAGLTVELACPAGKDGLHTARGVVTDVEAGAAGAARSTVVFRRKGTPAFEASALRVEAASGLDFVWHAGQGSAKKDTARAAGRLVSAAEPATVDDRLDFNYVLCGPDRARAQESVRHVVVTRKDGSEMPVLTLPAGALEFAGEKGPAGGEADSAGGPFCAQARVRLAEYTLDPGEYTFAIRRDDGTALASAAFTLR